MSGSLSPRIGYKLHSPRKPKSESDLLEDLEGRLRDTSLTTDGETKLPITENIEQNNGIYAKSLDGLHSSSSTGSLNDRLAKLSSPNSTSFWSSQPSSPSALERSSSFKDQIELSSLNNSGVNMKNNALHILNFKDQPTVSVLETNALMQDEDGTSSGDDEDEDDFTNVDEMDGRIPRSGSNDDISHVFSQRDNNNSGTGFVGGENPSHASDILASKDDNLFNTFINEKELPKFNPAKYSDEDFNLPVDQDLQKQLEKRACQIMETAKNNDLKNKTYNGIYKPISKPILHWKYKVTYFFKHEVSLWFVTMGNLSIMDELKLHHKIFVHKSPLHEYELNDISKISEICYFALGFYSHYENTDLLEKSILHNNMKLIRYMSKEILASFKQHMILCRDEKTNLSEYAKLLKYSSTIAYFMIISIIDLRKSYPKDTRIKKLVKVITDQIENLELMTFIIQYIEQWRWTSRLSMHIRSIMLVLNKLIILQFGDETIYADLKEDICRTYDVTNDEESTNLKDNNDKYIKDEMSSANNLESPNTKLKATPSQFEAFRADITSRYASAEINPILDYKYNDSASLTQFINIPRPKKDFAANTSLPQPQQDIQLVGRCDTPFPSPSNSCPSSPKMIHRSDGGVKKSNGKKLYQTNLNFPSIFPTTEQSDTLTSEMDMGTNRYLPRNIREAIDIMQDNVSMTLSDHQLSSEKFRFLEKEHGLKSSSFSSSDIKDFDSYNLQNLEHSVIMKRIETLYKNTLPNFKSLISVIMQLMELNMVNRNISSCASIAHKKSVLSKHATLSTGLNILYLLSKWFKLSHVCKYEYFNSLLYDSKYIELSTKLMEISFTSERYDSIFKYQNYLMFWDESVGYYNARNPGFVEQNTENSSDDEYKQLVEEHDVYQLEDEQIENDEQDVNLVYLNTEFCCISLLQQVLSGRTERLKFLPLNIGLTFKSLYQIFNLDLYGPLLKITKELTPFKSKKWKSEHMDLISGVYLYENLSLVDNWVTGKDTTAEINDSYSEEFAIRTLLQFYHFRRYQQIMDHFGYSSKQQNEIFSYDNL